MQSHILVSTKTAITIFVVLFFSGVAHICVLLTYIKTLPLAYVDDDPKFPIQVDATALTFVKTHRFGLYTNESDWDLILPEGEGFLYHEGHDKHYLLAHYHQLHCIRALRNYFLNYQNMTEIDFGHVSHCLMYLREMALCNVDLTLEPASHKQRTPEGQITIAVTGAGVTHRCKDWSQVRDYMTSNFAKYKDSYERKAAAKSEK